MMPAPSTIIPVLNHPNIARIDQKIAISGVKAVIRVNTVKRIIEYKIT